MPAADTARCRPSPRSCDDSKRAENHAGPAARAACRHWLRASNSTTGSACAAAPMPRGRGAPDRQRWPAVCPRYRMAAMAGRRTARSSVPRSGTRRAAPARTMARRWRRSRDRPRRRPRDSRRRRRGQVHRAPDSSTETDAGRRRNWRPSRWCGHSRAGPARGRDSRRRPAPASPCASYRPTPESRAAAARRAAPWSHSRLRARAS